MSDKYISGYRHSPLAEEFIGAERTEGDDRPISTVSFGKGMFLRYRNHRTTAAAAYEIHGLAARTELTERKLDYRIMRRRRRVTGEW